MRKYFWKIALLAATSGCTSYEFEQNISDINTKYTHPKGHQAYEYTGEIPESAKQFSPGNKLLEPITSPIVSRYQAVKPNFHKG